MNVVCVCLDTFRADIIGPAQPLGFVRTPNLDKFAAESVWFEGAFGECQPTLQMRRAFFTGMRSFPFNYDFDRRGHWHHAAGWHKIPPHQDTLAEILLSRGYATGLISDTYHMFKPTMNYTRGFCSYEFIRGQETDNYRLANPAAVEETLRRFGIDQSDGRLSSYMVQYLANIRGRASEEDYFAAQVFRTASRWLEENRDAEPFFLWVDAFDPHEPWDPPKKYAAMYNADCAEKGFIYPFSFPRKDELTREQVESAKACYFGEVTLVDKWVGVLFETITRLGLWDDTIVVVLSDHGTQLMEDGQFGKGRGNMRPYNTRFVWYLRHPHGPKGKKISAYVQSHDLMPTLLSLLGVPFDGEGQDAWPLVTGARKSSRDHIVIAWAGWSATEFGGPAVGHASVRDEEWCYVVPVGNPREQWEKLYHVPSDPDEKKDVAAENPDVLGMQRRRVEAVMKQELPGEFQEQTSRAPGPGEILLRARLGKPKEG